MLNNKHKQRSDSKVIENFRKTIEKNQLRRNDNHPIDLEISKEEYFGLLLSMKGKKKTEEYTQFLHDYLLLLSDFIRKLRNQNDEERFKTILFEIIFSLQYESWPENRLIMRLGEQGSKYYLILFGKVDVIIPSEKKETLCEQKYLRYLALLIYYDEIELLNIVINANATVYPIELIDQTYGQMTKQGGVISNDILRARRMTQHQLFKYLIGKEKNDYYKRQDRDHKRNKEIDNGITITSQEYISRINNYHIIKPTNSKEPNEMITVTIIYYILICSLKTGQQFGEAALSDPLCKRTATIITSSDCHFGWLNKVSYTSLIKSANEKYKTQMINLILSLSLFQGFSMKKLQYKYFNSFVLNKVAKGERVIFENCKNENLIIIKQGLYEVVLNRSLAEIGNIIEYVFHNLIFDSLYKDKDKEKRRDLFEDIKIMKEENIKFIQGANEIASLSKYYHQKQRIRLWLMNSPDTLGFSELGFPEENSIYELMCCSSNAEIFTLPKSIFQQICFYDETIRKHKNRICYEKNFQLVERLLKVRKVILSRYFLKNNINKYLHLDYYNKKSQEIFDSNNTFKKSNSQSKILTSKITPNRIFELNTHKYDESNKKNKKRLTLFSSKITSLTWNNRSKSSRNLHRNNDLHSLDNNKCSTERLIESNRSRNSNHYQKTVSTPLHLTHSHQYKCFSNLNFTVRGRNINANVYHQTLENFKKITNLNADDIVSSIKAKNSIRSISAFNLKPGGCSKYKTKHSQTQKYIDQRNRKTINSTRAIFLRYKDKLLFKQSDIKPNIKINN